MRFRGRIVQLSCVQHFAGLLHVLSKTSSQFVLRICPEKFVFVLPERDWRTTGAAVWCEIPKEAYFTEFQMVGLEPENNEIVLEIGTDILAMKLTGLKGIKSGPSAVAVTISLTRKVTPYLTFEIETASGISNTVCRHDVPVKIIPQQLWMDYNEPTTPAFDISVAMPEVEKVKRGLDRITSCGPRMCVTASNDGTLKCTVENYAVGADVIFQRLEIMESDEVEATPSTQSTQRRRSVRGRAKRSTPLVDAHEVDMHPLSYSVEMDSKQFSKVLPAEDIRPESFVLSIVEEKLLHIMYIFEEVTLEYFIPGKA